MRGPNDLIIALRWRWIEARSVGSRCSKEGKLRYQKPKEAQFHQVNATNTTRSPSLYYRLILPDLYHNHNYSIS